MAFRLPHLLGRNGEREAERFLKRLGYAIVGRGVRTRIGELDLIALDGPCIVFVEVKTRGSTDAGQPFDAVDETKRRKLTRTALGWLKSQGLLEQPARFDVVSVVWPSGAKQPAIEHVRGAFEATDGGRSPS